MFNVKIRYKDTRITHAQLIDLETTHIPLLPAPGTGKLYMFWGALSFLHMESPYGNVTNNALSLWQGGADINTAIQVGGVTSIAGPLLATDPNDYVIWQSPYATNSGSNKLQVGYITAENGLTVDVEFGPLQNRFVFAAVTGGAGTPLTDGSAENYLNIRVFYSVEDLAVTR